ncbi:MAG TPA: thiamine pyrophosphate-dependent dehydrogenase E1 component subunit alpha [Thermoanaerobaculia bacterium]|nr:thiamine pyrophosphate-dependent dehydrogenase E1 component subunit alpha [Thermoanaerobaculia bacterium]
MQHSQSSSSFSPDIFRDLYRIRRVEEEVARVYPTDRIKSPVHLSIGQEAISVAVCKPLRADDIVFLSYRSHAGYLAKGGDLRAMIAELYGKATGSAQGKGGSMHLVDVAHGVMGASAVVGTTIPHAIGYAYAMKVRREDRIVVCFFGDGATDEGVFDESLNFAALKRLPILFVCENNSYAIHTHQSQRHFVSNIAERARVRGIPSEVVEDDLAALLTRAEAAVAAVRRGEGPRFLECVTYRWKEHVGPGDDFHLGYRTRDEAEPWYARDAVRIAGDALDAAERQRIIDDVEKEIAEAFAFAEESPFPGKEELMKNVFAEARR